MDLRKWCEFALSNVSDADYKKIKFAIVFGEQGENALYVTDDDELWSFSRIFSYRASVRSKEIVNALKYKRVRGLCGSTSHRVAITENGDVYTWGANTFYNLGRGIQNEKFCDEEPVRVVKGLEDVKIKEVACGEHHTLALSEDGDVYAWGSNTFGQIGNNNYQNRNSPFRVIRMGQPRENFFVKIACQEQSSFALSVDGEVFAWGLNQDGELGMGNNTNQLCAKKVEKLSEIKISNIVCGAYHTLALSEDGELYAWGQNGEGELGTLRFGLTRALEPIRICEEIGRIKDIAAIFQCKISAALTEDSKVYMWGDCRGEPLHEPTLTEYTSLHEVFANFASPAVSYKPIRHVSHPAEEKANLLRTLEEALGDSMTSDLIIQIHTEEIRVHQGILKIRCPHFRTMLKEIWRNKERDDANVLSITTKKYPVFLAFLRYLYTGVVDLPLDLIFDLLDLATEYLEKKLEELCEDIIRKAITVKNALTFYCKASAMQNDNVQNFCLSYAANHAVAVMASSDYSKVTGKVVKAFVVKLVKRNGFRE